MITPDPVVGCVRVCVCVFVLVASSCTHTCDIYYVVCMFVIIRLVVDIVRSVVLVRFVCND